MLFRFNKVKELNMKRFLMLCLFIIPVAAAAGASDAVTPYGDYSQWCSAYGICRENLGPQEAERAIQGYFANKGLRAGKIQHRDRFIEAEIYRNSKLVDKVIFDRKTGRFRSTY